MSEKRLLIVEDEENLRASIRRLFIDSDIQLIESENGKRGLKMLIEHLPDVVVVDYRMPQMDGLEFIKAAKSLRPDVPVIVMTAHGNKTTSVHFLKEGAFRYMEKPFRPDEFKIVVNEAFDHHQLIVENKKLQTISDLENEFPEIIGNSRSMKGLFDLIKKVAPTDITVMVQGESGTGKELIAQAIHEESHRSEKPFIRFNCAALPETLIESELFGYEKGAFTGADSQRLGRFELAHEGTIFFDEIGELSLSMQVKLLRVLQEREFERVGGSSTIKADVRVIAATNQNLEDMTIAKTFREDLFYRLNTFPLYVPPLRERGDDVLLIATHFLKKYAKEYNMPVETFSDDALELLRKYEWKGNVRELQNVVSRAVVLSTDGTIPSGLLPLSPREGHHILDIALQEEMTEEELVRAYAREVYRRVGYNKKEAAERLCINYRTLISRLRD